MKRSAPSVTSVPPSPIDESRTRVRSYAITMSIRMLCFALAVLVTPYSWYTWLFALGAMVLPYIAVVIANASRNTAGDPVETPTVAIDASPGTDESLPRIIAVPEARE